MSYMWRGVDLCFLPFLEAIFLFYPPKVLEILWKMMFTGSLCWCVFCNALWGGHSAWNVSDIYCTRNVCLLKADKNKWREFTHWSSTFVFCACMCILGGYIPVCVLACRCSSSLRVKRFPQKTQLQTKGLSPVCSRTCARSREVFRKVFSQPAMWQMCFLFPTSPGLLHIKTKYGLPQWVFPFITAIHYKNGNQKCANEKLDHCEIWNPLYCFIVWI